MGKAVVEWSKHALGDIDNIEKYIANENPREAIHVLDEIQRAASILDDFPYSGKTGRVSGTRELVTKDVHYTIIYEVEGNHVMVLRVVRQSQQWPPAKEKAGLLDFEW